MSKLPNAPLQEVSAQLKWHLKEEDFENYGFLAGDYYTYVKKTFEKRTSLIPDGIPFQFVVNNPTHKFNKEDGKFPFIVIGPGIVAINADDENYYWEKFITEIEYALKPVFELVPELSDFHHIHLSLEYIDFFEFDFEKDNILDFLRDSMHTHINKDFIGKTKTDSIDLNFSYKDDELGHVKFSYSKGKIKGKSEGLIFRTSALSGIHPSDMIKSIKWFNEAHGRCSFLFKEMTKGKLYESFS